MNVLVTNVYNTIVSKHKEMAYLFFSYETVPFHCSEGKLDTLLCKRMIGHALRSNWQKADKKMVDPFIPSNDLDYQYVAYVKDDRKKDSEIKKVNLTSNWGAAVARYNQLLKGQTAEYTVGILSATFQQNWWYPMTTKTGNLQYSDVNVLLAEYCQKTLEIWKDDGGDEKAAKLQTKKAYDDKLNEADKKLKGLFTGSGDTLFQKYTFTVTIMHKRSRKLSVAFNQQLWSMKNAMQKMNAWTYAHVHKSEQDYHYLYTIKETVPLYCSEGDDFSAKPCQIMIGWALYHKHLLPSKKMVDKRLTGARALYVAYLVEKDGDKVIVKNLTQNKASATKVFLSLFQGEEQLYKAGCIGHSQKVSEWFSPVTALKGSEKNLDVWEALARYAQKELTIWEKHALSEKDAKLVTKKQILERQAKALKALNDQWKGTGETLFQGIWGMVYHDRTKVNHAKSVQSLTKNNMKAAFDYFVSLIYAQVIKTNADKAFLVFNADNGKPILCSDKSMQSDECMGMHGYTFLTGHVHNEPEELFGVYKIMPVNKEGVYNKKYTWQAVIKDLSQEKPKMEVTPLNGTVLAQVESKFKQMVDWDVKDSQKIGFMVHTAYDDSWKNLKSRINPTISTKAQANEVPDVSILVGEYVQSKVDWYKETGATEEKAKVVTMKTYRDDLAKHHEKFETMRKTATTNVFLKSDEFYIIRHNKGSAPYVFQHKGWNQYHGALQWMSNYVMTHIHKNRYEWMGDYLFVSRRHNVIHCSAGDLEDDKCKLMIGWAIANAKLLPPLKMCNNKYAEYYYALMRERESKEVVKIDLVQNKGQAKAMFDGLVKDRKYSSGVITHSKDCNTFYNPLTIYNQPWSKQYKNFDAYILLAEHAQKKHNSFKGEGNHDEKAAGYRTKKQAQEDKDALKKKIETMWTGGGTLAVKDVFFFAYHDKQSGYTHFSHWHFFTDAKTAMQSLSTAIPEFMAPKEYPDDWAWLICSKRNGPIMCSNDDMKAKECRVQIGFVMDNGWFDLDKSL